MAALERMSSIIPWEYADGVGAVLRELVLRVGDLIWGYYWAD
jgi:hypothetical protein